MRYGEAVEVEYVDMADPENQAEYFDNVMFRAAVASASETCENECDCPSVR
jgi:hypothetical protein